MSEKRLQRRSDFRDGSTAALTSPKASFHSTPKADPSRTLLVVRVPQAAIP
jgi:hypothetical protein